MLYHETPTSLAYSIVYYLYILIQMPFWEKAQACQEAIKNSKNITTIEINLTERDNFMLLYLWINDSKKWQYMQFHIIWYNI